jgi:hypothetical protein
MRSSFAEGKAAGYFGIGRHRNPYRKGDPVLMRTQVPALDEYASDWDSGYVDGEALALRESNALDKALCNLGGLFRSAPA